MIRNRAAILVCEFCLHLAFWCSIAEDVATDGPQKSNYQLWEEFWASVVAVPQGNSTDDFKEIGSTI